MPELWRSPTGKTHLCWGSSAYLHSPVSRPTAACRYWWPDLDTWLPVFSGGEITCRSCRRGTTITHLPAWELPPPADPFNPTVIAVRERWRAGLPAVGVSDA